MSIIDEVLKANEKYPKNFTLGSLPIPPARNLAIVACMDARLTVEEFLGLRTGDAHIIRNAGGIGTEDAVRSLIVSHALLGHREFLVITHADCGMLTFKDKDLQDKLTKKTGVNAAKVNFHAFGDLEENVRTQVERIRTNPFLPKDIPVTGF